MTVTDGFAPGTAPALAQVVFLAQDAPLCPNLFVHDTVHLAANLNDRFDRDRAALSRRAGHPCGRRWSSCPAASTRRLSWRRAWPDARGCSFPTNLSLAPLARHDVMASLMEVVGATRNCAAPVRRRYGRHWCRLGGHVMGSTSCTCDRSSALRSWSRPTPRYHPRAMGDPRVAAGPAGRAHRRQERDRGRAVPTVPRRGTVGRSNGGWPPAATYTGSAISRNRASGRSRSPRRRLTCWSAPRSLWPPSGGSAAAPEPAPFGGRPHGPCAGACRYRQKCPYFTHPILDERDLIPMSNPDNDGGPAMISTNHSPTASRCTRFQRPIAPVRVT